MTRTILLLRWLLAAAIALFAGALLWQHLQDLSVAQLQAAWSATPPTAIALSLLATAISFACLAGYERFATRQAVPGRVPTDMALRVGAVAHAIANTLGFHLLTAGALRYRAYRSFGLGVGDVARVVAVVGACVAAGVVAVSGMAMLALASAGSRIRTLSIALALLAGVVIAWRTRLRNRPRTSIVLREAVGLCVLGVIEMAAAIGALYVLMPASSMPEPASFVLLFVSATLLGIVSHVPGGIGVFEAAMLTGLPVERHSEVLIALLAYRAIYNLLPFALAVVAVLLGALRRPSQETAADQFDGG